MATKTITVELDAYDKLVAARREPRESFSSVIRRAEWSDPPASAGAILERLIQLAGSDPAVLLDDGVLDAIAGRIRDARTGSEWDRHA